MVASGLLDTHAVAQQP